MLRANVSSAVDVGVVMDCITTIGGSLREVERAMVISVALMALTIATGCVADDANMVLESIAR